MPKKLTYFNFSGYAEPIRYILHYLGEEFEDERIDRKQWPINEIKEALPFGKMPVLEENGRVLHQSMAIARYVAAGTDLLPSDPWEQAQLDAVVLSLNDLGQNNAKVYSEQDPVKKQEGINKILNEDVVYYFSRFEKQLKENNGYFGGKLSWVDFVFVSSVEIYNMFLKTNVEKNYPTIQKLVKEIPSLPGVKEYVAKRKPYVLG